LKLIKAKASEFLWPTSVNFTVPMRWLDNLRLSTELAGAPKRCVHVGDRESDIYELYCLAEELGTGFLVRIRSIFLPIQC
jgi:hypothetical protein